MEDIIERIKTLQSDYDKSCELNKAFAEDRVVVIKVDKHPGYETKILDPSKAIEILAKSRIKTLYDETEKLVVGKLASLVDKEMLDFYTEHKKPKRTGDYKHVVMDWDTFSFKDLFIMMNTFVNILENDVYPEMSKDEKMLVKEILDKEDDVSNCYMNIKE